MPGVQIFSFYWMMARQAQVLAGQRVGFDFWASVFELNFMLNFSIYYLLCCTVFLMFGFLV